MSAGDPAGGSHADGRRAATLEVRDLSIAYGAVSAVRDVSFSVPAGSSCCILGPNGAGKTTVANAIAGMLPSPRGTILVDGVDVSRMSMSARSRFGISYIPADGAVFPHLTVTENLLIGAGRRTPRQKAALIEQAAVVYPFIANRRAERAGMLSGGEQQMLALARLLSRQPRVTIVDEISHGLAPTIVARLFASLAERRGSSTFVIVEQQLRQVLPLADSVVVLAQGDVTYAGPASERTPEQIESFYRLSA